MANGMSRDEAKEIAVTVLKERIDSEGLCDYDEEHKEALSVLTAPEHPASEEVKTNMDILGIGGLLKVLEVRISILEVQCDMKKDDGIKKQTERTFSKIRSKVDDLYSDNDKLKKAITSQSNTGGTQSGGEKLRTSEEVLKDMEMLTDEYALCPDDKLTEDGKSLKGAVRFFIEKMYEKVFGNSSQQ